MGVAVRDRVAELFAAGVTEPPAPRPAWLLRRRLDLVAVADAVLALILFGTTDGTLGSHAVQHHVRSSGQMLLLSLLLCAPLAVRTWFPFTAWSVSAAAMLVTAWAIPPHSISPAVYPPTGVIVYGLCLYAVAVRCKPWVVIAAGIVTVAGVGWIYPPTVTTAIFFAAVVVLVGVIVRFRRGSREQLAVAERRHEGERALLEERQRIARELHDVVAHHMSVIAIQAEAAPYKVADPPRELAESFAEIRASALSGLHELRRVLGVLRSGGPDTAPQPGLGDLDALLESARNGGLTVTASVTGDPGPIPDGVDLSAYRIVQEALSNAMRHAPGAAVQVKLYYGEAALVIEVRNDGCGPGAAAIFQPNGAGAGPVPGTGRGNGADGGYGPGGGHGLVGMRERATMLGGYLQAGPAGQGEFLVTAALPLDGGGLEDPR